MPQRIGQSLSERLFNTGPGKHAATSLAVLPFEQPDVFYRDALTGSNFNADGSLDLDSPATSVYQCIEIGPRSDVDALLIFDRGKRPPLPKNTAGYVYDPMMEGRLITVSRPWVGEVKGPLCIIPPGAQWSRGTTRDSSAYARLRFDLVLHRVMPVHVARRRPDDVRRFAGGLAAGAIAATNILAFPAYGREDLLINFNSAISTSGALAWKVYGATAALGAGSEVLLDTINQTGLGSLNISREYEGKFDHYVISVESTVNMGDALSTHDIHVRLRDKL